MNDNGEVVKAWEYHDEFIPGYNNYGQARASLPNGIYSHASAVIIRDKCKPGFGNFYIKPETDEDETYTGEVLVVQLHMQITRDGCRR